MDDSIIKECYKLKCNKNLETDEANNLLLAFSGFRGLRHYLCQDPNQVLCDAFEESYSGTLYYPVDPIELRTILKEGKIYNSKKVLFMDYNFADKYVGEYSILLGITKDDSMLDYGCVALSESNVCKIDINRVIIFGDNIDQDDFVDAREIVRQVDEQIPVYLINEAHEEEKNIALASSKGTIKEAARGSNFWSKIVNFVNNPTIDYFNSLSNGEKQFLTSLVLGAGQAKKLNANDAGQQYLAHIFNGVKQIHDNLIPYNETLDSNMSKGKFLEMISELQSGSGQVQTDNQMLDKKSSVEKLVYFTNKFIGENFYQRLGFSQANKAGRDEMVATFMDSLLKPNSQDTSTVSAFKSRVISAFNNVDQANYSAESIKVFADLFVSSLQGLSNVSVALDPVEFGVERATDEVASSNQLMRFYQYIKYKNNAVKKSINMSDEENQVHRITATELFNMLTIDNENFTRQSQALQSAFTNAKQRLRVLESKGETYNNEAVSKLFANYSSFINQAYEFDGFYNWAYSHLEGYNLNYDKVIRDQRTGKPVPDQFEQVRNKPFKEIFPSVNDFASQCSANTPALYATLANLRRLYSYGNTNDENQIKNATSSVMRQLEDFFADESVYLTRKRGNIEIPAPLNSEYPADKIDSQHELIIGDILYMAKTAFDSQIEYDISHLIPFNFIAYRPNDTNQRKSSPIIDYRINGTFLEVFGFSDEEYKTKARAKQMTIPNLHYIDMSSQKTAKRLSDYVAILTGVSDSYPVYKVSRNVVASREDFMRDQGCTSSGACNWKSDYLGDVGGDLGLGDFNIEDAIQLLKTTGADGKELEIDVNENYIQKLKSLSVEARVAFRNALKGEGQPSVPDESGLRGGFTPSQRNKNLGEPTLEPSMMSLNSVQYFNLQKYAQNNQNEIARLQAELANETDPARIQQINNRIQQLSIAQPEQSAQPELNQIYPSEPLPQAQQQQQSYFNLSQDKKPILEYIDKAISESEGNPVLQSRLSELKPLIVSGELDMNTPNEVDTFVLSIHNEQTNDPMTPEDPNKAKELDDKYTPDQKQEMSELFSEAQVKSKAFNDALVDNNLYPWNPEARDAFDDLSYLNEGLSGEIFDLEQIERQLVAMGLKGAPYYDNRDKVAIFFRTPENIQAAINVLDQALALQKELGLEPQQGKAASSYFNLTKIADIGSASQTNSKGSGMFPTSVYLNQENDATGLIQPSIPERFQVGKKVQVRGIDNCKGIIKSVEKGVIKIKWLEGKYKGKMSKFDINTNLPQIEASLEVYE